MHVNVNMLKIINFDIPWRIGSASASSAFNSNNFFASLPLVTHHETHIHIDFPIRCDRIAATTKNEKKVFFITVHAHPTSNG